MPTISEFYGIQIRMFMNDHPPPHFHARYGEFEACFSIVDGAIIEREMRPQARRLIREWVGHIVKSWLKTGASFRRASFQLKWEDSMLTTVTSLKVIHPYGLEVRFNDGSGGVHDCSALIERGVGPVIRPLKDPAFFARVYLEWGAPTWPNSYDMDAEWLRREMLAAGELHNVAAE